MSHTFLLFNISGGEFILVALIFLVLFGPKQIPTMARSAAKVIKQVRNATNDIKREIMDSAEDQKLTEVKKTIEEGRDAFKEVTDSIKRGTKI
ncbi:MAG: Sec-independent protein translocase subunit TatA/TatB [Schleiferiaceae bacterium]|jgi:sec-independent protein translocase protein TatA|nr:MAG: twin-arginine translocase TatA/TatE family subunit [Bacteroidota bacterium]REK60712.1 MAG: twin-arginine translocase TatA/TatE family subunit [Bacteroidota bacterium]